MPRKGKGPSLRLRGPENNNSSSKSTLQYDVLYRVEHDQHQGWTKEENLDCRDFTCAAINKTPRVLLSNPRVQDILDHHQPELDEVQQLNRINSSSILPS